MVKHSHRKIHDNLIVSKSWVLIWIFPDSLFTLVCTFLWISSWGSWRALPAASRCHETIVTHSLCHHSHCTFLFKIIRKKSALRFYLHKVLFVISWEEISLKMTQGCHNRWIIFGYASLIISSGKRWDNWDESIYQVTNEEERSKVMVQ